MRARFLLAVVGFVLLVLATATLWIPGSRRATNVVRDQSEIESAASATAQLEPPTQATESTAVRAVAIEPAPRAMPRTDFVPGTFSSEDPPHWSEQPKQRIFGNVRSRRDGTPIGAAEITCADGFAISSVETPGTYELRTSIPNLVSVTCRAHGWQGSSRMVAVSDQADTMADFELDPVVEMTVRLRDRSGRPLLASLTEADLDAARLLRPVFVAGYLPRGSRLSGNVVSMRATSLGDEHTDAWYRVSIDNDAGGSCCLALGDRVVDVVRFTSTTTEIVLVASREDIQASAGSLRLSAVDDETGFVIPGLCVRVTPSAGVERIVKPDARGIVLFEGLPEGDAKVEIASESEFDFDRSHTSSRARVIDHPLSVDTVVIRAGELTDLGRKRLEHTVSITGWVDAPPGGGWLPSVFALHDDAIDGVQVETVRPDAQGKFKFSGLKSGYYRVGCHYLPEAQMILVDARLADVVGVHIVASSADQQREGASRSH